jgi:3-hydroxyacyl-CoA dehydrogenase
VFQVKKAAVIGAGVMGSGIAAQFANGGIPVVLLDVVPSGGGTRNILATAAVEHQLKAGGFMHPDAAELVVSGNLDDDFDQLADADWIVEAIVENPDVKRTLFKRIDQVRKPGSIVSSNTSTIRLSELVRDQSATFVEDFVITHFCNPPRPLRLLEVVAGSHTAAATIEGIHRAADQILGKTVLDCRDTPGFVANRIGCFWMAAATVVALHEALTVEEADAIAGAPFGVPKTGIFRLWDLCGIDLVPPIWGSLQDNLPAQDALQAYRLPDNALIRTMIDRGWIGAKGQGGFYRQVKIEGKRATEVLDLDTLEYRPADKIDIGVTGSDGLRALCERDDPHGRYAWRLLSQVISYAAEVVDELVDDIRGVDVAMRLGYGWKEGPFKLADRVGPAWIADRLTAEGRPVPSRLAHAATRGGFLAAASADGTIGAPLLIDRTLADIGQPVIGNDSAIVWDIGSDIVCLELRTKMNVFDDNVFDLIEQAVDLIPGRFKGMVIGNTHSTAFSSGANLGLFLSRIRTGDFAAVDAFLRRGQEAFSSLRFAPFPVIGAAHGLALGGGCEILFHCDRVVAHAELHAGLPEVKPGLLPGWGGCTHMLFRRAAVTGDIAQARADVANLILSARVSHSALEAKAVSLLQPEDMIVMNRDNVIDEARTLARTLADAGYAPPIKGRITTATPQERAALIGSMGDADPTIAAQLATILCGPDNVAEASEEALMQLERAAVVHLARQPVTAERIMQLLPSERRKMSA